jgi:hypothetical protein
VTTPATRFAVSHPLTVFQKETGIVVCVRKVRHCGGAPSLSSKTVQLVAP